MGILPDAYISKHEVFKVDVQLLPPAVCLQYKIFKIFCVYTMVQRPNILPPQISHLLPGVSGDCSFCHVPWLPSILCPAVQRDLIVAFWRLWLAVLQTSGGGRWSPLQTLWPHTLQVNCVTIGYRVWGDDDGGGDGEGHDDEAQCCAIVLGGEIIIICTEGPDKLQISTIADDDFETNLTFSTAPLVRMGQFMVPSARYISSHLCLSQTLCLNWIFHLHHYQ